MAEWVVYWLHDAYCICLQQHGYVGISGAWTTRLAKHQRNKRFPPNFEWSIIFTGTKAECLAMEHKLRPVPNVGWNQAQGGKPTINFTDEVLANMRKPKRSRKQIEADRLAAQEARRSGVWRDRLAAAGMGHIRSDASRMKQSAAMKGKPKSAAHRAAISEATKSRYARAGEREKTSLAVRAAFAASPRIKGG